MKYKHSPDLERSLGYDDQDTQEIVTNPNVQSKLCSLFTLKCLTVPPAAMFSSLSLPLTIMVLDKRFLAQANSSMQQKLLQTLIPYSGLVGFRTWLLWYKIGKRLDGKADTLIEEVTSSQEDKNMAVMAGLTANLSALTNGMLVMFLILQDQPPIVAGCAGVSLGLLNYATDLVTDVADSFRKYVEHEQISGNHIHPFFKQKLIQRLFQHKLNSFGILLREILPVIAGIIRSQTTAQVTTTLLEGKISQSALAVLNLLLGITVYESSAYFAKFEVIQFHENLKAAKLQNFELENYLVRSNITPVRIIGKMISGQLLVDTLQKIKISATNAVNITYVFAAIGLISLIFTGMQAYVCSTNSDAVDNNKEGLLFNYYNKKAAQIAPEFLLGNIVSAVILGSASMFAQSATIKKYTNEINSTQVAPDAEPPNTGSMQPNS